MKQNIPKQRYLQIIDKTGAICRAFASLIQLLDIISYLVVFIISKIKKLAIFDQFYANIIWYFHLHNTYTERIMDWCEKSTLGIFFAKMKLFVTMNNFNLIKIIQYYSILFFWLSHWCRRSMSTFSQNANWFTG